MELERSLSNYVELAVVMLFLELLVVEILLLSNFFSWAFFISLRIVCLVFSMICSSNAIELVAGLLATGSIETLERTVRTSLNLLSSIKNLLRAGSSLSWMSSNQDRIGIAFSGCRH